MISKIDKAFNIVFKNWKKYHNFCGTAGQLVEQYEDFVADEIIFMLDIEKEQEIEMVWKYLDIIKECF